MNPSIMRIKVQTIIMDALELQILRSEIQQEADLESIAFEVIHCLCEVVVL